MNVERQFPPNCPNCGALLAVTAQPHCPMESRSYHCGWLTCQCGTVVDSLGNHSPRKQSSP